MKKLVLFGVALLMVHALSTQTFIKGIMSRTTFGLKAEETTAILPMRVLIPKAWRDSMWAV